MCVTAAAAAVIATVYKGNAATPGNELAVLSVPVNSSNTDSPSFASDVDIGAASHWLDHGRHLRRRQRRWRDRLHPLQHVTNEYPARAGAN
jgi:hypothetical protein